jgi:hypothetical protein
MFKRILMVLGLIAFAAALVSAEPVKGKVTAIDGKKVTIEVSGEKASWVKKGAPVKFEGGVGRILTISDTTIVFNSKNASKLKVGAEISLDKGPATLTGC